MASLPPDEFERLAPSLSEAPLLFGQRLIEPDHPPASIYFVRSGLVSVMIALEDGRNVESIEMGNEGVAGLDAILGNGIPFATTVVQSEGISWSIPSATLRSTLPDLPALGQRLGYLARYNLQQAMQTAACNAFHPVAGRLARWLLIVRLALGKDEFYLTQEFIADMLAAHRPTLTMAAIELRDSGAIDYQRGHITIIDAERLEMHSCECYSVIHRARDGYLASLLRE